MHGVPQKRKRCVACNIVVGLHYYYASGDGDRGSHDGSATLSFHMLHDPSCAFLMVDTSQKIFVQVRLVSAAAAAGSSRSDLASCRKHI
jgi:hypothetical protein